MVASLSSGGATQQHRGRRGGHLAAVTHLQAAVADRAEGKGTKGSGTGMLNHFLTLLGVGAAAGGHRAAVHILLRYLAVIPVPRMSSGPSRQLQIELYSVHAAANNSCN